MMSWLKWTGVGAVIAALAWHPFEVDAQLSPTTYSRDAKVARSFTVSVKCTYFKRMELLPFVVRQWRYFGHLLGKQNHDGE